MLIERKGKRGVMALTALRPAVKPRAAALPMHGNLALKPEVDEADWAEF